MLTEMVEYVGKIDENVKTMKSEIKENVQGTNSVGKEIRTQKIVWSRRNKETFNQNRMKKREFKKVKSLTNLWDNLKHSNIWIIGVPEGEEEDQEIENLFEQIMKENSPNLVKEIEF